MRSLNEQIRTISAIAERHQQLQAVVTDEEFEQEDYEYPLLHIIAGPWQATGNRMTNKFLLVCLDLGSQDGTNRYEALSDTQQVLADILTTLQKESADLPEPFLEWEMSGDATKIVDGKGDNATGWMIEVYCNQQNEHNPCNIPIEQP
jgi:hypothetical protein